ncbi:MAG: hypothetical protein ACREIC_05045, partial [Limisphaerales bacterium]
MTLWTLIRRSLRFHARSHVGVVLGAAIGSAALIGALIVGDSVRQSLTARALARLGPIHFALNTPDRLFQSSLAARLTVAQSSGSPALPGAATPRLAQGSFQPVSTALSLPGIVSARDGASRANQVNILGVDPASWSSMAGWVGVLDPRTLQSEGPRIPADVLQQWRSGQTALINEALAEQLSIHAGDEILVRVRKPSALALDAAISPRDRDSVALRLRVGAIIPAELLGDFRLSAQPLPPNSLFVPLDVLGKTAGVEGRANLLTVGPALSALRSSSGPIADYRRAMAYWLLRHSSLSSSYRGPAWFYRLDSNNFLFRLASLLDPKVKALVLPDEEATAWLEAQVHRTWTPEDAGLSIRAIEQPQT